MGYASPASAHDVTKALVAQVSWPKPSAEGDSYRGLASAESALWHRTRTGEALPRGVPLTVVHVVGKWPGGDRVLAGGA
jgi:hypothetical protein